MKTIEQIESFNQKFAALGVEIHVIDASGGKRFVVSLESMSKISIKKMMKFISECTPYKPRFISQDDKFQQGYEKIYDQSKKQITYQHVLTEKEFQSLSDKLTQQLNKISALKSFNQKYNVIGVGIYLVDTKKYKNLIDTEGEEERFVVFVNKESNIIIDEVENIVLKFTDKTSFKVTHDSRYEHNNKYNDNYLSRYSQSSYLYQLTIQDLNTLDDDLDAKRNEQLNINIGELQVDFFNKLYKGFVQLHITSSKNLIIYAKPANTGDEDIKKSNKEKSLAILKHLQSLIKDPNFRKVKDTNYSNQKDKVICRDGMGHVEYNKLPSIENFISILNELEKFIFLINKANSFNQSIKFHAGRLLDLTKKQVYTVLDENGKELEIKSKRMISFTFKKETKEDETETYNAHKEKLDFLKDIHPKNDKGDNTIKLFSPEDISETMRETFDLTYKK